MRNSNQKIKHSGLGGRMSHWYRLGYSDGRLGKGYSVEYWSANKPSQMNYERGRLLAKHCLLAGHCPEWKGPSVWNPVMWQALLHARGIFGLFDRELDQGHQPSVELLPTRLGATLDRKGWPKPVPQVYQPPRAKPGTAESLGL